MTVKELEPFRDNRGKFESLYTIVINDILASEVVDKLYKKLELVNLIKDKFKKKYLNDRVYSIVEYFKQLHPDDKVSGIYLVGKELEEIELNKNYKAIMEEWNVDPFIFRNGEYFDIDYLNSLFEDLSYFDIIKINNKKLTHYHLNPTKKKVVYETNNTKEMDLEEYIRKNTGSKCLVHGVSSLIKTIVQSKNLLVYVKELSDSMIFDEFEKDKMKEVHACVSECIGHMSNEKMEHRIKIGKDLQKSIAHCILKTMYCTSEMLEKVNKNVPKDLLNFEIVEVRSLETGDVGDVLEKDYGGAIGFTYY